MDDAIIDEVAGALKDAEDSRKNLAATGEKLKEHLANLRKNFEKHVASMEVQTRHKLEVLLKEQTRKIDTAKQEVRERLDSSEKSPNLNPVLKRLAKCSDVTLEFEISPDLDRLRFLSEFGILRVKDDANNARKGKKEIRFCRPASEIVQKHKFRYQEDSVEEARQSGDNTESTHEADVTTDSGFIVVSTPVTKEAKGSQHAKSKTSGHLEDTKPEVTSKERDEFVTLDDGRIVTFSKAKGNVTLLNKACSVISEYKVACPKAVCCLKQDNVLVVIETWSHDKILALKVTEKELVKVNSFRIKCHDRICDITRKGMSVYVMCSGNHLHILDT